MLLNIMGTRDICIDGIYCSYRAEGLVPEGEVPSARDIAN